MLHRLFLAFFIFFAMINYVIAQDGHAENHTDNNVQWQNPPQTQDQQNLQSQEQNHDNGQNLEENQKNNRGSNNTQNNTHIADQSMDSVFLNNEKIEIKDKPLMIIFGKDGCYYCDILSASLISNATIQGYILLNFSAYYINLDDKKRHNVSYLNLSRVTSADIARIYKINALPIMIFISHEDSKEIMRVVGFPGEGRIINLIEFVNNNVWKNFANPRNRIKGFLEYEKEVGRKK